ncbi:MAG: hypothetical protein NTY38_15095 [Acidobacteria bacterium]|nr:hypothetical protein [Acidobacteriota bacterium]
MAIGLLAVFAAADGAPERSEKIRQLVDSARSLPPEFAADVALRLADSDAIQEKAWKLELYEAAFQLAGAARAAGPGKLAYNLPDSRQRFEGLAAGLGLDRASIQLRAVLGILRQKPGRARELFAQVTVPAPTKLTCADALVSDPGIYYETLGKIFEQAYTPEERAEQEPVRMLLAAVQSASSSVQLAPLAKALLAIRVTQQQRELLTGAFAARLGQANDDDRTYNYALVEQQFAARMNGLIERAGASGQALADTWKAFSGRQEKATRCQGVLNEQTFKMPLGDMTAAASLNPDEKLPNKPELALHVKPYPADEDARKLTELVRGLWISSAGQLMSPEQKQEAEWRSKALDAVSAVDGWQPASSDNAVDVFHEKLALYRGLLQAGAGPELQERVLQSYLNSLCGSGIQSDRPAEWLVELHVLLDLIRTPKGIPAQGQLREAILKELVGARNPVAAIYGALETENPAGVAEWRGMGVNTAPR